MSDSYINYMITVKGFNDLELKIEQSREYKLNEQRQEDRVS